MHRQGRFILAHARVTILRMPARIHAQLDDIAGDTAPDRFLLLGHINGTVSNQKDHLSPVRHHVIAFCQGQDDAQASCSRSQGYFSR
jgi:hypothetical protein